MTSPGLRNSGLAFLASEFLKPGLVTYPELLQKSGYKTAVVGKWHLADETKGFDYSCILPGQGVYIDPDFIENGERKQMKGYATDITTDPGATVSSKAPEAAPGR